MSLADVWWSQGQVSFCYVCNYNSGCTDETSFEGTNGYEAECSHTPNAINDGGCSKYKTKAQMAGVWITTGEIYMSKSLANCLCTCTTFL